MTNLQELIKTLEQAQRAIETIEEWKQIIFEEADFLCLQCQSPDKGKRDGFRDMYSEIRDIMCYMNIIKEWKNNSEAFKESQKKS